MLVPARDGQGHRRYSAADLALAAGIRRAQATGASLAQIRAFLTADAEQRAALLAGHRDDLLSRLHELAAAAETVSGALRDPRDPHCPYGL